MDRAISIVLCTARRQPQFGWLADSISTAISQISVPAELICVDKLLWEASADARRSELSEAIKGRFPHTHIPPKPTVWQGPSRLTSRDYYALCNARNTGIARARGKYVILVDDCSVVDRDWAIWHVRGLDNNVCVAGSFRSYLHAEVSDGKVLSGELHPSGVDSRGDHLKLAPGGWFWGLNCGFPLAAAIAVNGYDEQYDGQGGSEDCDLGIRLERVGFKIIYAPECKIYQILTTHEAVCETEAWGRPQPTKQKELMMPDGRLHFANEMLIYNLQMDPTRHMPMGNQYRLSDLRGMQDFPCATLPIQDWRDGQLLSEM